MMNTDSLHRHAQTLNRLYTYWEGRAREHDQTDGPALTVALAREPGTPAAAVAAAVGERLDWPVYDHELLEQTAHELHQPVQRLEPLDERGQNWLMDWVVGFGSGPAVTEEGYLRALVRVIRTLGQKGRCVLIGHAAEHILPPHSTLRVNLVGAEEDRIGTLMRGFHLGHEEAARRLGEIGRDRARFIQGHFHKDPAAPGNYELALNTSQWSVAECADFIVQAVQRKAAAMVH